MKSNLHIVLVNPQIPQNTGSIGRLCAATQTKLHLIRPLGFSLEDRYLKRAGLDYWPNIDMRVYDNFHEFLKMMQPVRLVGFSKKAELCFTDFRFQKNDFLLFGSETEGLPEDVRELCHSMLFIPIDLTKVRSLNLAMCAGIGLYEAMRQLGILDKKVSES